MTSQADKDYWADYTPIQKAKHDLLQGYLGGWFPILASFSGHVLYVDCHAGRGRHETGDPGSPLVALTTLLGHRFRNGILTRCQVHFIFLEEIPNHAQSLQSELGKLGPMPQNIDVRIANQDYERVLREALDYLEQARHSMAPSFFFFDPYGFKLPMDLLQRIVRHPRSELLITFMVRYIDMAIHNPAQEENMNLLFGTADWRKLQGIRDPDERHGEMIRLYTESLGCSHSSVLEMRGEHREHKYSLIHATNHPRGRELMKQAMWKLTDGSYAIYQSNDPRQLALITLDPDLAPLENELLRTYGGRDIHYQELTDWLLDSRWLPKHLNQVIRKLVNSGRVEVLEGTGRFIARHNQLLRILGRQA